MWQPGWEGVWVRMDTCIRRAESLHCSAETITTLLVGYVRACSADSVVSDSATSWTVARQAPLSMGFCGQEYWSGLPCPPPGDFPDLGIEPASLRSPALAARFFNTSTTWKICSHYLKLISRGQQESINPDVRYLFCFCFLILVVY